jgi:hypothetical protein
VLPAGGYDFGRVSKVSATTARQWIRGLVALEIVLGVGEAVTLELTQSRLPLELREYLEAAAESELTPREIAALAAVIPLLVLLVVSWIGLWRLWRPARRLYFIATVSSLALIPLLGPHVDAGWSQLLGEMGSVVSGALLALLYFSPARRFFASPPRRHGEEL